MLDVLGRAWATSAWGELRREQPLEVHGAPLPDWLSGQYFLASSAGYELGKHNITHAFDGFSKVLRWRLEGGHSVPTLRARLLQSEWLNRSLDEGDIVPSLRVGPLRPPLSKLERMESPWKPNTDNFNVKIHEFAPGRFAALSDVSDPKAAGALVDSQTLSSHDFRW